MKLIKIGDPHVSDKAPSTRKDNYNKAILGKLEYSVDYANTVNAAAILLPGDLFHRKIPSHNSHQLIRDLITIFSKANMPILSVAGNHDISGTLANLGRQPISVLEEAKVIKLLEKDSYETFTEGDIHLSVSGHSFDSALDSKDAGALYNLTHWNQANFRIGLFHQMILPDDQSFFSDYINFKDLTNVNSDLLVDGHYHVGFNPSMIEQDGKYFLNSGSLSRGSSEDFNLEKQPKICEIELIKVAGSVVPICTDIIVPHTKASEIFDMAAVTRRKENKAMKEFITNLNEFEASSLTSETPDGIIQILKAMEVDQILIPIAEKYLSVVHERLCD